MGEVVREKGGAGFDPGLGLGLAWAGWAGLGWAWGAWGAWGAGLGWAGLGAGEVA